MCTRGDPGDPCAGSVGCVSYPGKWSPESAHMIKLQRTKYTQTQASAYKLEGPE